MAEPGTPDWWLDRLYKRLRDRQRHVSEWDGWYSGEHPAPMGYEKATQILQRMIDACGLNVLAQLTDAAHERMHVEGFKVGGAINDAIWEIWQSNNFDAASEQVFLEKMALSEAYVLVDPNDNGAGQPRMTPEHPSQCIVEYEPGTRRLAAGAKVWQDDLGERPMIHATVYLPDDVHVYSAPTRMSGMALRPAWEYQDSRSGSNPLQEVSLVPFSNRPRMLKAPVPEFAPAIPVQRRINKTLLDRLVMQEYGAFKQKWATGVDIPTDPETGQPFETYNAAVTRIFTDNDPNARFGQFEAEDIKQMLDAVDADVKHAAVLVPTPPDQLLGEMVNVSAEGLKSAQASLISRVRRHMRHDEEPLEVVARLALKAAGATVPDVASMTTVWRNPEFRTEGELVDALTKMATLDVPREALWERWGATPQEITEWRRQRATQDAEAITAGVRALNAGTAEGG